MITILSGGTGTPKLIQGIKEIYPEGSEVTHVKYGQGTIKSVAAGKIVVEFEDSLEKILAAKICVKNKLLKVV